jgi:hypothetical protein
MRVSLSGPLIALALAALPAVSIASCAPGAEPSYGDITAIYFRSENLTEPVAIRAGDRVEPGACPVSVVLYSSPSDVEKAGGPYCFRDRSGKWQQCCGATDSTTEDSPQLIFDRLLAVLRKDRLYDLENSSQVSRSDGVASDGITVMRCGAQPHEKGTIAFVGPPQPGYNTSIVSISVPFGTLPESLYSAKILTLFDDFTRAIYQSQWEGGDIY